MQESIPEDLQIESMSFLEVRQSCCEGASSEETDGETGDRDLGQRSPKIIQMKLWEVEKFLRNYAELPKSRLSLKHCGSNHTHPKILDLQQGIGLLKAKPFNPP